MDHTFQAMRVFTFNLENPFTQSPYKSVADVYFSLAHAGTAQKYIQDRFKPNIPQRALPPVLMKKSAVR